MGTRSTAVTNARVREAVAIINNLIQWAAEDAAHAMASGAPGIARDDIKRFDALMAAEELLSYTIRKE